MMHIIVSIREEKKLIALNALKLPKTAIVDIKSSYKLRIKNRCRSLNFLFLIWQRISNIWNSTWTSNMGTPHREFDYFRVISRRFQIAVGPLEFETIAEGLVRARLVLWRCWSERERSKFDKAGNLLFRTRLRSSPRRRLLIFVLLPAFPRTSVHLLRFSTRPTLLIFGKGGILCLLFSFIKYTDPRRDSILLGGLLFVVPSPASVTGSGSASLSFSLSFSVSLSSPFSAVKLFSVYRVNAYIIFSGTSNIQFTLCLNVRQVLRF